MDSAHRQEVTVVDIRMPFMSMVVFMVKWVIASIPAMLILGLIFMAFSVVFRGALMQIGTF
ncbi:MAG: hypothetical protein H6981_14455 [Gammaproteobacteria bacterium]|nr:hypothetical protein [Gammaproteobacteria bacterium]MCP5137985.1 hypothetical protein [Gammaproteobacteria bacterium]